MKTLIKQTALNTVKTAINAYHTVHRKAPIIAKTNAKLRASGVAQVTFHLGKFYYVPHIWNVASSKPVIEMSVQQITDINERITIGIAIDQYNVPHVDISYPIVIDQNGYILDGRHRWTQARMNNISHIKVQQVHTNELQDVTNIVIGITAVMCTTSFILGVYARKALVKRLFSK